MVGYICSAEIREAEAGRSLTLRDTLINIASSRLARTAYQDSMSKQNRVVSIKQGKYSAWRNCSSRPRNSALVRKLKAPITNLANPAFISRTYILGVNQQTQVSLQCLHTCHGTVRHTYTHTNKSILP